MTHLTATITAVALCCRVMAGRRAESLQLVDCPQAGHGRAPMGPGHLLMTLVPTIPHLLVAVPSALTVHPADHFDTGGRWAAVSPVQGSAEASVERVVAGNLEDSLAGHFAFRAGHGWVARPAVGGSHVQVVPLGPDLLYDVFDDGFRHGPAESFHHIVAEEGFVGLSQPLETILQAAELRPPSNCRRTIEAVVILFRVLAGHDDVRHVAACPFRQLLLPQGELGDLHDGGDTVGTGPLGMPLLPGLFKDPGSSSGPWGSWIHGRRGRGEG